ncbi:MAG: pro-sigmaK processing inhibitor BofA family protein [Clostridia bacterium]|nr:pro-sigmaK processing inhibitor BofA family protein [Clostridia bacterium]
MFYVYMAILALIVIVFMIKKMTFSKSILSVLTGLASLFACDLMLSFFGGNMPINIYTLLISGFAGIPGVILLTLLRCFI